MIAPTLANLLEKNERLFAIEEANANAAAALATGATDDPDSFDAEGGTTGPRGYYPVTLPSGDTVHRPSDARLLEVMANRSKAVGFTATRDLSERFGYRNALPVAEFGFITTDDDDAQGKTPLEQALINTAAEVAAIAHAKTNGFRAIKYPETGDAYFTDRGAGTTACRVIDGFTAGLTIYENALRRIRVVRDIAVYGAHDETLVSNSGKITVVGGTLAQYEPINIPVVVTALEAGAFLVRPMGTFDRPAKIDFIQRYDLALDAMTHVNNIHTDDAGTEVIPPDVLTGDGGAGQWRIAFAPGNLFLPTSGPLQAPGVAVGDILGLTTVKRGGSAWKCINLGGFKITDHKIEGCGNVAFIMARVHNPVMRRIEVEPAEDQGFLALAGGFLNMAHCTGVFRFSDVTAIGLGDDFMNVYTMQLNVWSGVAGASTIDVRVSDTVDWTLASPVPAIGDRIVIWSADMATRRYVTVTAVAKVTNNRYTLTLSAPLPAGFDVVNSVVYNEFRNPKVIGRRFDVSRGSARGLIFNCHQVDVRDGRINGMRLNAILCGFPITTVHPNLMGFRGGLKIRNVHSTNCVYFPNVLYGTDFSVRMGLPDAFLTPIPDFMAADMLPISFIGCSSDNSGMGGAMFQGVHGVVDIKVTNAGRLRPATADTNQVYQRNWRQASAVLRTDIETDAADASLISIDSTSSASSLRQIGTFASKTVAVAAALTLPASAAGKTVEITAGASDYTVTLPTAPVSGDRLTLTKSDTGAGIVTIQDGATARHVLIVKGDSVTYHYLPSGGWIETSVSIKPRATLFTASGTFTKSPGMKRLQYKLHGGGGGGGSGARTGTGVVATGGGAGSGAGVVERQIDAALITAALVSVTVGAGGAGGAAIAVDSTAGADGSDGAISAFGSAVASYYGRAYGGAGGGGGRITAVAGAGGVAISQDRFCGNGGSSSATGGVGGASTRGYISGGGAGGGITTGNVASAGGAGNNHNQQTIVGGAIGAAGGAGEAAPAGVPLNGASSGSGGGSALAAAAGAGGAGGGYGGAGGGGGASRNGFASGAGGTGANGACYIIEYFS